METRCKRFEDISISEKMLYSLFLLTIGIGYLFALTHMVYTHQMRDGQTGVSVDDVMIAYYGSMDQSRLGAAISGGPMEMNLKSGVDKQTILNWLQTGKSEAAYQQTVAPILNRDCTGCHSPTVNQHLPDLTNYQGVIEVASAKAASLPSLVKVSHIHLFGIAFILLLVGRIFIFCEMNVTLKRVIVVIPFVAMLIDTLSWFITRHIPGFAYVVVASGALMGLAMGAQIVISLYQMWVDVFPQQSTVGKLLYQLSGWFFNGLAATGAFFREQLSPYIGGFWIRVFQVLLSLYQISLYKLSDSLSTYANEQRPHNHARIKLCQATLEQYGYEMMSEGNGWLVKESWYSWRFIDALPALEQYVAKVQRKNSQLKQA